MTDSSDKSKVVKGTFWSSLEKFSNLFIHIISSIIIARLLSPEDFGLVGMLAVFSAIGNVLIDSGFGQGLIRKLDATEKDYSSIFYLNVFIGFIVYIILYLLSPYIASFYHTQELETIAKIAFIIIPINAFGIVPYTKLIKQVNFKSIYHVSLCASICSASIGILYALYYKDVYAIVLQTITYNLIRVIFMWYSSKWIPMKTFSIQSIISIGRFSVNLLISGIVGTIYNNIYTLIIGKNFNKIELGFYSQAKTLQDLPNTTLTSALVSVTYPVFSSIQHDVEKLRQYYLKTLNLIIYIIGPIMLGLIFVANPLFEFVLSSKWNGSILYFQYLCPMGILSTIHALNIDLLKITGRGKQYLYLELGNKFLLTICILMTMHLSIIWLIKGLLISSTITVLLDMYICGKVIKLNMISQVRSIITTLLPSLLMCLLIFIIDSWALTQINSSALKLAILTFTGCTSYYFISKIFKVSQLDEVLDIIIEIKKR